MNKKIFLFCISLPHVISSCFIEDMHQSMKLVMQKTTFTTDKIKQEIVTHDNNINEIEFTIVDNTVSKRYDSKNNSQITVDSQTRVIFFELQKIQYKNPHKSQISTFKFKITNKIKNEIDNFVLPVYRLPGVKRTYKDENFFGGCFIIFADFSLDKIFAQENQENIVFYYTKQQRTSYDDVNKIWRYTNNNTKHYINQTNKDDAMVFSGYDSPERYEFFIEYDRNLFPVLFPLSLLALLGLLMLYSHYYPETKIAKFLSKEII